MTIRVALVGFGLGGAVFHAPFIATTPGLRLDFVVTRDPARRQQAEREHPGVRVLATTEELWVQARDVDLVVVASPNRTHAPLAIEAMARGLAVVVDKPMATSVAEARAMIDEAARRGVVLAPYQNRRWDGDFLTLRRLLAEGALGEPLRLESRLERWRPEPKPGWRELGAPEEAGGLLYDLGSHLVDQAIAALGPVREVYAELDSRRPGVVVDDDVFLALAHVSGARSHLHASLLVAEPAARLRLVGTRGTFTRHGADPQEAALRAGERPGGAGWGVERGGGTSRVHDGTAARDVAPEPGAWPRFYAGMVAALRDGAPPPVDPRDAMAGLAVIEAARRSVAERRVVAVEA